MRVIPIIPDHPPPFGVQHRASCPRRQEPAPIPAGAGRLPGLLSFFALLWLALLCLTMPGNAQTFELVLGQRSLGWVEFGTDDAADRLWLTSRLDNTPYRVFDGTFSATQTASRAPDGAATRQFESISVSPRLSRTITVQFGQGRPLSQTTDPPFRRVTGASLAEIPAGTGDLLDAFRRVGAARDCPGAFLMYEGLRLVRVAPRDRRLRPGLILCDMVYSVIDGPPHLPPVNIRRLNFTLIYSAPEASRVTLARIDTGLGPLRASLVVR